MTTIAFVSEHASPLAAIGTTDAGGQNIYVACLAGALAHLGHEVTVYTRRDDANLPTDVRTPGGYRVHHLDAGPPTTIDKDDLLEHVPALGQQLADALEQRPADVVHSHFWMSGVAAVDAVGGRTPVVHTFHALGTVKRRHQGVADRSPSERLGAERALLAAVDTVVATCSDEVHELAAMWSTPPTGHTAVDHHQRTPAPIEIVPCGYDDRRFRPTGTRMERSTRPRLAAVSRLVPRKGLADVLRAMSLVPGAELIVAGGPPAAQLPGDPAYSHLRDLAADLGVSERVRFLGGLEPTTIAALDRSADVFVSAPWYEPFGIAPVEAMACAVPVVGTAVGGLLDTVVDGGTGRLVPPRDPDALAFAIRGLLDDRSAREMMGARAAWRAARRFRWSVVARQMAHVYAQTIDRHARSAPHARLAPAGRHP